MPTGAHNPPFPLASHTPKGRGQRLSESICVWRKEGKCSLCREANKLQEVKSYLTHNYLPRHPVAAWVSLQDCLRQSLGELGVHGKLRRNTEMTNQARWRGHASGCPH